jgi:hypothetical protein
MTPTDDQLSLLSQTITKHAREVAAKEWLDEHKPVLLAILARADLGNLDQAVLAVNGQPIPIKAIVSALHEQFLAARTKALTKALAEKVVKNAMRQIEDESE